MALKKGFQGIAQLKSTGFVITKPMLKTLPVSASFYMGKRAKNFMIKK